MIINERDLQWTTVRSGCQNNSYVKVTHIPTGIFGSSEDSEYKARMEAYNVMAKSVMRHYEMFNLGHRTGT